MKLEHTYSKDQMQPYLERFLKLMHWAAYESWNPRILESWLETIEKSPLSRKYPKVLQPAQARGYMGSSIERILYCPSLSTLPGDAESPQIMSLGIHTHDTLEKSSQMIKSRVRWCHHELVSSCLYWGLSILHSFVLVQSSQDFARSIE